MPKSPVKNPQTKSTNWRNTGRSRPSCAWQAVTARSSKLPPPEPSRTTQMSPGMRRISKNTSAAAPTRVGTTNSRRFMMYRYIAITIQQQGTHPLSRQPDLAARDPVVRSHFAQLGSRLLAPLDGDRAARMKDATRGRVHRARHLALDGLERT